ncbi:YxeA family protein [Bacillus sp. S13(2024)]|uniref:YxeA family protein n=1 Tax=unclassified Bacillus (in: firmicutes) TaxID=185979 RepID=UPI003D20A773
MKKYVISVITCVLLFLLSSAVVLAVAEKNDALNIKKWGTKEYYVQITENGKEESWQSDDGETHTSYWYTLKAYDEKGKEVNVKFFANKNLKLHAFLRVYVNGEYPDKTHGIQSYEEITKNELPMKAKEKLSVK